MNSSTWSQHPNTEWKRAHTRAATTRGSFKRGRAAAGVASFLGILTAPHALGVVLYSGQTVPLVGTTSAARPEIGGAILDTRDAAFGFDWNGSHITGTVSQRIRAGYFPFFSNVIDFRISAFDDHGVGMRIESIQTQRYFGGNHLDVDFRVDEPGVVFPSSASSFAAGADEMQVRFEFGNGPLLAGESSRWMFVGDPYNDLFDFGRYEARMFVRTPDGMSVGVPFDSYSTYIPAPSSLPVLMLGLLPTSAFRRQRHVPSSLQAGTGHIL